ncbi:MAG: hypothetical protein U9Q07_00280 [Planctomycetota bacterium]|nr:hypothetical protein [Planctomycetota bacterium]
MSGYQLEAVNDMDNLITVRSGVVYTDKAKAEAALETLQRSTPGGMTWRLAVVEIDLEAI